MSQPGNTYGLPIHEERFDRIRLHNRRQVTELVRSHIEFRDEVLVRTKEYVIEGLLDGFGKTERIVLSAPATWWQHLKLTLRVRWPRVFGRLRVRTVTKSVDVGALIAGLHMPRNAGYAIMPYTLPTSTWGAWE